MSWKPLNYKEQQVGRHVKSTKLRLLWEFELDGKPHNIEMFLSKLSGKRKAVKDGKTLVEIQDRQKPFQQWFHIGKHILTLVQNGQKYDLIINTQAFSHMWNQLKTNMEFNFGNENPIAGAPEPSTTPVKFVPTPQIKMQEIQKPRWGKHATLGEGVNKEGNLHRGFVEKAKETESEVGESWENKPKIRAPLEGAKWVEGKKNSQLTKPRVPQRTSSSAASFTWETNNLGEKKEQGINWSKPEEFNWGEAITEDSNPPIQAAEELPKPVSSTESPPKPSPHRSSTSHNVISPSFDLLMGAPAEPLTTKISSPPPDLLLPDLPVEDNLSEIPGKENIPENLLEAKLEECKIGDTDVLEKDLLVLEGDNQNNLLLEDTGNMEFSLDNTDQNKNMWEGNDLFDLNNLTKKPEQRHWKEQLKGSNEDIPVTGVPMSQLSIHTKKNVNEYKPDFNAFMTNAPTNNNMIPMNQPLSGINMMNINMNYPMNNNMGAMPMGGQPQYGLYQTNPVNPQVMMNPGGVPGQYGGNINPGTYGYNSNMQYGATNQQNPQYGGGWQ